MKTEDIEKIKNDAGRLYSQECWKKVQSQDKLRCIELTRNDFNVGFEFFRDKVLPKILSSQELEYKIDQVFVVSESKRLCGKGLGYNVETEKLVESVDDDFYNPWVYIVYPVERKTVESTERKQVTEPKNKSHGYTLENMLSAFKCKNVLDFEALIKSISSKEQTMEERDRKQHGAKKNSIRERAKKNSPEIKKLVNDQSKAEFKCCGQFNSEGCPYCLNNPDNSTRE